MAKTRGAIATKNMYPVFGDAIASEISNLNFNTLPELLTCYHRLSADPKINND